MVFLDQMGLELTTNERSDARRVKRLDIDEIAENLFWCSRTPQ